MYLSSKVQKIAFFTLILLFVPLSGYILAADVQNGNLKEIVSGNNEFAFELYSKIKKLPEIQESEGNLFISPYSISTAFAMVYSGARENTAKEIEDVLCFPAGGFKQVASGFSDLQKHLQNNQKAAGFELNLANSLWLQKGYDFVPEFLELNKKYFNAGLSELDFAKSKQARNTINSWVEEHTKEKIKDLIPSGMIDGLTRLILTNAIYFKGNWVIPFKEENTKPADFNVTENEKVQIQMMYQKERYKYANTDDMELLQIPYGLDDASLQIIKLSKRSNIFDDREIGYSIARDLTDEQLQELPQLSMLIILPKSHKDLELIERKLNPQTLNSYIQKMKKQKIEIYLPKFKFSCGTIELKDILRQMGMKDAFKESVADFTGINPRKELFISNVLHKSFVEVNEKGTEASSASGLRMTLGIESTPPIFRADRPFFFMIKDDKTESILFMGRVVNPSRQD